MSISTLPGNLAELSAPPHKVLAEFIHGCSPDPATRTMAAAALVLTLWQLAGRPLTRRQPWMIALNAGEAETDPIDAVASHCSNVLGNTQPGERTTGAFAHGSADLAPTAMLNAVRSRETLGKPSPHNTNHIEQLEERYRGASNTGYGSGTTRSYSRAWHEELGLVTDSNNEVILRLDAPADRAAFRQDILSNPERLLNPVGIGETLATTSKSIAVSGSLTPDLWDDGLVVRLLDLGLPVFYLPHLARDPLENGQHLALQMLGNELSNASHQPVTPATHLPPTDWFRHYTRFLRERLHRLPEAFEFSVLQIIHELGEVCSRIALRAAPSTTPVDETSALYWDLHALCFRGIVMGITSLAWHCLGFDPGCPHPEALKVMKRLRGKGPLTRRDLQRGCLRGFTAAQRDLILERLAAEDLVRLDGKMVAALSPQEFVQALHARPEFPEPPLKWPLVTGKHKS